MLNGGVADRGVPTSVGAADKQVGMTIAAHVAGRKHGAKVREVLRAKLFQAVNAQHQRMSKLTAAASGAPQHHGAFTQMRMHTWTSSGRHRSGAARQSSHRVRGDDNISAVLVEGRHSRTGLAAEEHLNVSTVDEQRGNLNLCPVPPGRGRRHHEIVHAVQVQVCSAQDPTAGNRGHGADNNGQ